MKPPLISFFDLIAWKSPWQGLSSDVVFVWAFSGDRALTPADVDAQFFEREPFLHPLRRRMRNLPGRVDRPYWTDDSSPLSDHIRHDDQLGRDWNACQDSIVTTREREYLDPRKSAWMLHAYYDVWGVPGCGGAATVIAFRFCHALVTGVSAEEVAQALFGSEPRMLEIPGQAPAVSGRLPWLTVARLAATAPFRAALHGWRGLRRDRSVGFYDFQTMPMLEPTSLNSSQTRDRVMRSVRLDLADLERIPHSVTLVGLLGVSRALERYFLERGEAVSRLVCMVPVHLGEVPSMGVNPALAARVDLFVELEDLKQRADAIAESLLAERKRLQSPEVRELCEHIAGTSWPTYLLTQAVAGRFFDFEAVRPVITHTTVSSVNGGSGPFTLCGQKVSLLLMAAFLGGPGNLLQCFMGVEDSVTLAIQAAADVPELDRYVRLVEESFEEVISSLGAR